MGRLGALVAALMLGATAAAAEPVRAKVEGGVLLGEATDRAHVLRAVPYAAAPVGDLRWAPPKPVVPWAGERDATKNGPSCPQVMNADGTPNAFGGANGPVSEDCLHLYVFAPLKERMGAAKKAPVMVWI